MIQRFHCTVDTSEERRREGREEEAGGGVLGRASAGREGHHCPADDKNKQKRAALARASAANEAAGETSMRGREGNE